MSAQQVRDAIIKKRIAKHKDLLDKHTKKGPLFAQAVERLRAR